MVYTDHDLDRQFLTQDKWDRGKGSLRWIKGFVVRNERIPHKPLLSHRGFLTHVSLAYPFLKPHMKGVHLTANSWRDGRDEDGWPDKLTQEAQEEEEADFEDTVIRNIAQEQLEGDAD